MYSLENESGLRGLGSLEWNCGRPQQVMDTGVTHPSMPCSATQREKDQLNNLSGFRHTQKVVDGFPVPGLGPHKPLRRVWKEPRLGNFIYIHI